MNAISLLKQDHRTVEGLFKQFEALGDRAATQKRRIVDQIIRELAIHASIEETIFYPAVRAAAKFAQKQHEEEADDQILEALEEHHIVKWTLNELDGMDPEAERFLAKVTVLMESVRHHVEEEEEELFPTVSMLFAEEELEMMGEEMEMAKKVAPTKPHPRAPDHPPGNLVVGAVAAVVDRGLDVVKGAAARLRGKKPDQHPVH